MQPDEPANDGAYRCGLRAWLPEPDSMTFGLDRQPPDTDIPPDEDDGPWRDLAF